MPLIARRQFWQAGAGLALAITDPAWVTCSEPPPPIRAPGREFLATLPHLMELAKLPGLGIGVVEEGRVTWQHYAGVKNATTKESITPEALFPAASMGKQVFAYGVILLVQK